METIRTAIVLVFLLAILYGAYVVLNQPMPQAPLEVGWNEHPLEPPKLDFTESSEAPTLDLPDLPPTSMTGSEPNMKSRFDEDAKPALASGTDFGGGFEPESAAGNRASYDAPIDPNPPVDPPPLLEDADSFADPGLSLSPVPPPAQLDQSSPTIYGGDALPTFRNDSESVPGPSPATDPPPTSPAAATAYRDAREDVRGAMAGRLLNPADPAASGDAAPGSQADPYSLAGDSFGGEPQAPQIAANAPPAQPATNPAGASAPELPGFGVDYRAPSGTPPTPTGLGDDPAPRRDAAEDTEAFHDVMIRAADLVKQGKPREALAALTPWHRRELTPTQRQQLVNYLDPLAGRVVYSRAHLLSPPYYARGGESLQNIAERYRVPWQLLANINGLKSPLAVPAQTELKVAPGPFRAEVDLSDRELTLYIQDLYAGRFPVTLGEEPSPETGKFSIRGRSEGQTYYAANGEKSPPRDPRNPYGGVWMDLGEGMSLHESPGPQAVSTGCLGLSSRDAQDVFGILAVGSEVTIVP